MSSEMRQMQHQIQVLWRLRDSVQPGDMVRNSARSTPLSWEVVGLLPEDLTCSCSWSALLDIS